MAGGGKGGFLEEVEHELSFDDFPYSSTVILFYLSITSEMVTH